MKEVKSYIDGQETQAVIARGEILEKFYNAKAGEIFRALINGLITKELSWERKDITADRILGHCEAYMKVQTSIEQAINEANELQKPLEGA